VKSILITGAAGFIGGALCRRLASDNKIIGVDITSPADEVLNVAWEQADLTNRDSAVAICKKYSPDVVIHCAGIAHQKIGAIDSATYMRVNSDVTENLAKAAAKFNSDVRFIFLSSVSVYGENPQITQISLNKKDVSRKGA
jgi:nucleoside-diphosphate-sugar epimerase